MFADDFGYVAKEQTPLDQLCSAIRHDDTTSFDSLLETIGDIDSENGRALLVCAEHDRYLMAKKLILRGADTFIVAKHIEQELRAVSKSARFGPIPASEEQRPRFNDLSWQKHRLATWKKEINEYVAGIGTLQKIESLEAKVDALHAAIESLTSARTPTTLKKSPAGPQP